MEEEAQLAVVAKHSALPFNRLKYLPRATADTIHCSVVKIYLPHKILWQMLIHSHYRMWSKYFLQQNHVSLAVKRTQSPRSMHTLSVSVAYGDPQAPERRST